MVEGKSVTHAVVEAVADAEGVDPVALTPPLSEAINPDALDQIFTTTPTAGRMDGMVTFSYKGYDVTVSADGYVSVEEQDE